MTYFFQQTELAHSADFFRQIVMDSADAILAIDESQKIIFFNPAAEKLFGYGCDEVLGRHIDMLLPRRFRAGHSAHIQQFQHAPCSARYMGDRKSHVFGLRKDGTEIPIGSTITKVEGHSKPVMVAILRDLSERMVYQDELSRLASSDPLTGVLNRRAFLDSARHELHRAIRTGAGLYVMLLDIDRFKVVNDSYGHDVGDRVICGFAETVRSHLRDFDLFGRWGGEEFIAAVLNVDLHSMRDTMERIRRAVSELVFDDGVGERFHVTVSIGASAYGDQESICEIIKQADKALYAAKESGRDRVVIHEEQ